MKRTLGIVLIGLAVASLSNPTAHAADAKDILKATGVKGGLIVHVGCGDGKLTAALRAGEQYLVHGLDTDAKNVAAAREYIRSLKLCGKVSVEAFSGESLAYADNLVNLLVADDLGKVTMAEVMRVLAPRGVAYVKGKKTIKPWPKDIDEWTHHLHDAGGNAVAADRVVGPPRRLQWTAGPLWARSHGYTPSVSAMVSARGRLFFICDETLTGASPAVPSKWFLVARDAFSGVLLWKRPVPVWGSAEFSGTPDTGGGAGSVGRFTMPPNVGKRLVAVGETVYVTLGPRAPVTALDAATGKTRIVYKETARADEILCVDGRLVVSINPDVKLTPPVRSKSGGPAPAPGKSVCAIDAKTGRMLWKKGPFAPIRTTKGQDPLGRLELAAGDGRILVLTRKGVHCLDIASGETTWRIDRPALPAAAVTRVGYSAMYEYGLTVMVYRDGVVVLAQPEPDIHHTYHTTPGVLYAFNAKDGKQMWQHPYGGWGHHTQHDVFVVGDVVWTHVHTTKVKFGPSGGGGKRAVNQGEIAYRIQGLDLRTGKLRKELSTKDLFNVGHHHRCYRNKISERFLMSSRRGVEFVNLANGVQQQHHWVRSGCLLGSLPCNGLLYVVPHPCACYIEAKLIGFNALAPAATGPMPKTAEATRLEKGPAFGRINRQSSIVNRQSDAWPTYRHDARRSGGSESAVSAKLSLAWRANIGSKPSGLTVAGGKVHVAAVDAHTVHALAANSGKTAWRYTADGRVDSPPTIHDGLAIFGSDDGRVYCLRDSDGALAWRFDAAPRRRLVMAFGRLASPWPVSGSVLIHGGKCWFAAGRSSYLDGGIYLHALDPATGKVAHRKTIYSPDPKTGIMSPETSQRMIPGLLNDIPSADGKNVFIRQMCVTSDVARAGQHLYSSGGFLDSSWFNRTLWKFGRAQTSGLMVLGDGVAYGVELYASRSRETVFAPGTSRYRLVCRPVTSAPGVAKGKQADKKKRRSGRNKVETARWEKRVAIRITAMARAGETLFVAGSPDIVDPKDPHGAWEGRSGGVLAAFATADGRKLAEYKLPSPPVWDGLAVAGGRVYIATMHGEILAFGPQ